jgi:hypothetical protein
MLMVWHEAKASGRENSKKFALQHKLFAADTQREKQNKMGQENVIYSSGRIAPT